MGHHWHPGSTDIDTGIDGEIELVDPGTDEVRNFRIGVQSKATEGIWRSETADGFLYGPASKAFDEKVRVARRATRSSTTPTRRSRQIAPVRALRVRSTWR